jgi:FAD-linked oxidoreductase
MTAAWTSWSGLAESRPRQVLRPTSPAEVADAVVAARASGLRVKMPGSGHSFTDIATTDGVLLDPTGLTGLVSVDREAMTVTALAGTTLRQLNAALDVLGLALHNMGDVDPQTLAGALATGTHGSGGVTSSLSGQLSSLTLVDSSGTERSASLGEPLFDAARVGLGALGLLTTVTFRVEPAFVLEADERPMSWQDVLASYDELTRSHHHVDLYWFPHTDNCLVKTDDRTLEEPAPLSRARAWVDDELLSNTVFGWVNRLTNARPSLAPRINAISSRALSARTYRDVSHKVFVSPRRVVFREMEYSLPREVGMEALAEARRVIERRGWNITFPVEVRCTPPDQAWLSTTHDRESVYLAFHVHRDTDHRAYFEGVEEVLRAYDGRPHWGKLHTRTAADLALAYPRFGDFLAVRDELDPDRVFTNPYLERVLG